MPPQPILILVMGPSGVGKSTVGRMLADRLGAEFVDADDHCPTENRDKMSRGIALTDEDRVGWHRLLNTVSRELLSRDCNVVLACPAHREIHRKTILSGVAQHRTVYLHGDLDLIRNRVAARKDHFFPPSLVAHQFSIMEPPSDALWLDVARSPDELVAEAMDKLCL